MARDFKIINYFPEEEEKEDTNLKELGYIEHKIECRVAIIFVVLNLKAGNVIV